jgi:hypothetical protein
MFTRIVIRSAFLALVAALAGFTPARAEWYVSVNPQTGAPQVLWSAPVEGAGTEAVYVSRLKQGAWTPALSFVASSYADESLSAATTPAGELDVVWSTTESTGRVLLRALPDPDGEWGPEVEISDASEPSEAPCVVTHAGGLWIAWQIVSPSGSRSIRCGKLEGVGNIERWLVADSPTVEDPGVGLHSENGHLWVDWIDSTTQLGASEYLDGSWQTTTFEPYAGADDVDAARGRVRARVLGL